MIATPSHSQISDLDTALDAAGAVLDLVPLEDRGARIAKILGGNFARLFAGVWGA